ncbi:hypothetical protein [Spartinivicinus poritis]|uniref:Uncharacterized protein n=1 Tax=Spartinivicinus poritis TaxID=2994640 RepID=A0ABT5UDR0_9GAMM|nr:hypothetical protein [Spartinivicinus sp. A2-2]MDE1464495.1 hypothetical protein [Spartinivicinus sp. A2-2]
MTRSLSRFLKGLLRGVVAVALFTPWYVDNNQDYLAPAGLVALYDALTKGAESAYRAGHVVAVAELLMFVLLLGLFIVLPSPKPKRTKSKAEAQDKRKPATRQQQTKQKKRTKKPPQQPKERITPTI